MALPGALPEDLKARVDEYPFTKPPPQPSTPPNMPVRIRRETILKCLRRKMPVLEDHLAHLRSHPEDAKWLKEHAEPKFWERVEARGIRVPEDEEAAGN